MDIKIIGKRIIVNGLFFAKFTKGCQSCDRRHKITVSGKSHSVIGYHINDIHNTIKELYESNG